MSVVTLKIKYITNNHDRIIELIKNYNSIFGLVYNYIFSNNSASTKDVMNYLKNKNNLELDTHFRNSAIYDVKPEISKNKDHKIIFGGKKLFLQRLNNAVTSKEYKLKKLRPLCMVGVASNKCNGKFQIISENEVLFKPSRKEHFILSLESVGRNYKKYLNLLIKAQSANAMPITYKLGIDYIHISFESSKILEFKQQTNKITDRVFAIDLNPNYVGYSVVDWKSSDDYKVVGSGLFSIKELNDYEHNLHLDSDNPIKKKLTNKRKYEVVKIAYELCKLANHFRCSIFSIEDLNITSSDKGLGKIFNRLCNNQWNRNLLANTVHKLCDCYGIKYLEVTANYSSLEGNLAFRKEQLPDMCLSSIEIGRRGYEFYHQYIEKDTNKKKNIIFTKSLKLLANIAQSLEELNYVCSFKDLKELYYSLKKTRRSYRVPISDILKIRNNSLFSKIHIKSYTSRYTFV